MSESDGLQKISLQAEEESLSEGLESYISAGYDTSLQLSDVDLEFDDIRDEPNDSKSVIEISTKSSNSQDSSNNTSDTYLEEYLDLLTSRKNDSPRECSNHGPILSESTLRNGNCGSGGPYTSLNIEVPTKNTKRKWSTSSDKTYSRGLGSKYLDSYLVNLTDFSWIIYPTETKCSQNRTKKVLTPDSSRFMRRKLHFIDPDKFFKKKITSEELRIIRSASASASLSLMSSNSEDKNGFSKEIHSVGYATSPDISSSIFDKGNDDSCLTASLYSDFPISNKNKQSYLIFDETPEWQCDEKEVACKDPNSTSGIWSKDLTEQETRKSALSNPDTISYNLQLSSRSVTEPKLVFNSNKEVLNTKKEESSSSSDPSSTTQPSTIVMTSDQNAIQTKEGLLDCMNISNASMHKNENPCVTDEDSKNYSPMNGNVDPESNELNEMVTSSTSEMTQDDSLRESRESLENKNDNKLKFLVELMEKKQQQEIEDLKQRHIAEMQTFQVQLCNLTEAQVKILSNAYNSSNSSSLNELFHFINASSSSISLQKNATPLNMNQEPTSVSCPPISHSSSSQSFFLHGSRQDNEDRRPEGETSKISQIFSSHSVAPQSITEILANYPDFVESNQWQSYDGSYNSQDISLDDCKSVLLERNNQLSSTIPKRTIEVGLDLVPAREKDLASIYEKIVNSEHIGGICKFQAVIRGRRVRKMMRTSEVVQLLSTLKEVAKLAQQFHYDILSDNIRKGDIGFHRTLFNQEKLAREKLHHLMVELNSREQVHMIELDRLSRERELERKSAFSKLVKPVTLHSRNASTRTKPSVHFAPQLSTRQSNTSHSGRNRVVKTTTTEVVSEPIRPWRTQMTADQSPKKTTILSTSKDGVPKKSPAGARAKRVVPSTKSGTVTKSVSTAAPRGFLKSKPTSKKSPATIERIPNVRICKSERGQQKASPAKASAPLRGILRGSGDASHSKATWR